MAIKYVRADITTLKVDAIVNTANPHPVIGKGCDSAVYKAAGADKLLKARKKIGNMQPGEAEITSGYNLSKFIIHTVGPNWIDGQHGEFLALENCYRNSLQLAIDNQCKSIAFPLISTGVYGFPKAEALNIATSEINAFLLKHSYIEVTLCIFDEDSFVLSGKIGKIAEELINDEKAKEQLKEEYEEEYDSVTDRVKKAKLIKVKRKENSTYKYELSDDTSTLAEKIKYYETALDLKHSDVYKNAWMPRRTYSRIMLGNYSPKKEAMIRLCISLKLSLEQSSDLLARNSMAFNPSDSYDRLITECIKEKIYDFDEINKALVKMGLEDKIFYDMRDILSA